jgi:hypothetical protein
MQANVKPGTDFGLVARALDEIIRRIHPALGPSDDEVQRAW